MADPNTTDPNTTETPDTELARMLVQGVQEQHRVNVENIDNVYPLLDNSCVSRYEVHHHMLEALKNNFIQKIITQHWDQEKFTNFLSQSMPKISIKEFRDIIFEVLKKYPDRITEEIYEQLAREPTVIHEAPIMIKRGLYERDQEMFKEMIKTQIDNYFKRQSLIMQQRGTNSDILDQRTNIPELKYIIDLVNESSILFNKMQDIMIEIYKDNGHSIICSFRFDFFNCMQKAGKISMCMKDHSYNMIWNINEGIIKGLEERAITAYKNEMNKYNITSPREFSEIAMIFRDPIVYYDLSARIVEALKKSMSESPDGTVTTALTNLVDKQTVKWMSSMVTFGSQAHGILLSDTVSMPTVEEDQIYSTFYKKLLHWTYDDIRRAPETAIMMSQEIHEDSEDVPLNFPFKFGTDDINILKNYDFATKVLSSYLLDRCKKGDIIALRRALDCLDLVKTIDPFMLQLIINELIDQHFIRILYSIKWQMAIEILIRLNFEPLIRLFEIYYDEPAINFLVDRGDLEKLKIVKIWCEKAGGTEKFRKD
ncbi:hypothetical protein C2G38_2049260 [Gigaspora rosea]|uniref:Cofactor of BRCA1-domain-containing protein n=1 Tax=Gigaspora rosea TaxID=44941 RepID=A0A397U3W4_9GLOM|nr:hypothetical protein C2G38_2049260 [Gigaspora rosea]